MKNSTPPLVWVHPVTKLIHFYAEGMAPLVLKQYADAGWVAYYPPVEASEDTIKAEFVLWAKAHEWDLNYARQDAFMAGFRLCQAMTRGQIHAVPRDTLEDFPVLCESMDDVKRVLQQAH